MERLADLIEQALQCRPGHHFKPPKFEGSGDVELFIEQFQAVQEANQWPDGAALLHLRTALEGSAREHGRGDTLQAVYANLRSRYGLTELQARDRLAVLRWERGQDIHTVGMECERLVDLGYPDLPAGHRGGLAVDALKRCIDNKALSRHLLAVNANTVEQVVMASQAFLQVGQPTGSAQGHVTVNAVENSSGSSATAATELSDQFQQLLKVVQSNAQAIKRLTERATKSTSSSPS